MQKQPNIILLTDVLETKARKEAELKYYQQQLEKLQNKMFFLKKDIDLTNLIIDMIEQETILDIKENLLEKDE